MAMFDMFKMFGKLNEVKASVQEVKDDLKNLTIIGTDPSDSVTITITGDKQVISIDFDPAALLPERQNDLEKATKLALESALKQATEQSKELIQKTISEKYPEIAGMDIGKYFG